MAATQEHQADISELVKQLAASGLLDGKQEVEQKLSPAEKTELLLGQQQGYSSGSTSVYRRMGRDLQRLQQVQEGIALAIRREKSPFLQLENRMRERVAAVFGKEYKAQSLEELFDEQNNVIHALQGSLAGAKTHASQVVKALREYMDGRMLPGLAAAVADVKVADSKLEELNSYYERIRAQLGGVRVSDRGYTELYRSKVGLERKMRETNASRIMAMQRVVFRNTEREVVHEYDVMATNGVMMLEHMGSYVASVLEHTQNLQSVYALFREGAETLGALNQAFNALSMTVQFQTGQIGLYVRRMVDAAQRTAGELALPGQIREMMAGYRAEVLGLTQQAGARVEQEALRIMASHDTR